MTSWIKEAVFYHIYPLGFVGAAQYHEEEITHSIKKVEDWIPHMKKLGVNALYLGPVFESHEHGYDTSDYRLLDPVSYTHLLHQMHPYTASPLDLNP